jgi:alanyl-tRNA synthetase
MEFWNLVFMQYNQSKDGSRTPLPKPSIDTGAGLERILALMQGTDSVWETDVLFPMIESAQSLTSKKYKIGDYDDRDSFSLRVLAEHARSSMMLVNDGVFPSNENRGYVLRRIIRRAVRHAYLLGTEKLVMPTLAETAISVMSGAYPDLLANKDFIVNVLSREEERFRQTLKTGLTILEGELSAGAKTMSGTTAFTLHDTYGFPIELTQEIAGERSVLVDVAGFSKEMQEQRDRAKSARKGSSVSAATVDSYREVMEQFGTTNFVGYVSNQCEATVLAVLQNVEAGPGIVEVFLDVSPFYAESGGQVGDTGTIRTESGEVQVLDTTFALPGLRRHTCSIVSGDIEVGQSAKASINVVARDATRRNHTATHMLHWALRQVLGEHVKQAGSHVSPDRLRFDFSHYAPVSASEIEEIERLTNEQLIANGPVRAYETSKDEATAAGAIAFFGDKYGDIVRVLEAGVSVELCGGTHVGALGDIGMVKVVTESSIGSNLRRIEAVTGANAVEYVLAHHRTLTAAASLLGAQPSELVSAIQRKIDESKALGEELRSLRSAQATSRASEMAASAQGGVVVSRVDGVTPNDLRELALAIRQNAAIKIVVLGGVTDTGGVALVATVSSDVSVAAGDLIRDAAKAVGGGGGGKGDIATAGGKDPSAIDAALELARSAVAKVLST